MSAIRHENNGKKQNSLLFIPCRKIKSGKSDVIHFHPYKNHATVSSIIIPEQKCGTAAIKSRHMLAVMELRMGNVVVVYG